jgi:hypothetical protein
MMWRAVYARPDCLDGRSKAALPGDLELALLRRALPIGLRGRGLHSSTSQLNLSRVCHKKTPYTP